MENNNENIEYNLSVVEDKIDTNKKVSEIELDIETINKTFDAASKNVGYAAIKPSTEDRLNFARILEKLREENNGKKVSQTEAFSKLLKTYIEHDEEVVDGKKRSNKINFSSNQLSVRYHLEKLLTEFKDMEKVAQDTISINTDNFNAQMNIKTTEISTLSLELDNAKKEIEELKIQLSSLDEVKALHDEKIASKDAEIDDLVKLVDQLKTQLSDKDSEIEKLKAEKDSQIQLIKNNNNSEIESLKKDIQSMVNYQDGLNLKVSNLESEKRILEKENTRLTTSESELRASLDNFSKLKEAQIKDIEKSYEDKMAIKEENIRLSCDNMILKKDSEINKLQSEIKSYDELKSMYDKKLNIEKESLEVEYSTKLSKKDAELTQLKDNIKSLEDKLKSSNEDIKKTKKVAPKSKSVKSTETTE